MHISSAVPAYVCFAQQAAHMEQLFMEKKSDVICLAIAGYEPTPPQCAWRSTAHSEERTLFGCFRSWKLWFSSEKSLGGWNLISTKRKGFVGPEIVYSSGCLRNTLKVSLIFQNRKVENRANVFHSLLCWKQSLCPFKSSGPREFASICCSVCILLALLNRLALKRTLMLLWWFKLF